MKLIYLKTIAHQVRAMLLPALRVARICDNSTNMKQYVVDELRPEDYDVLKKYLDEEFGPAEIDGIYWITVPGELLADTQRRHEQCRPHLLALDLDQNRIACELLVRTKSRLRCDCIQYATERQRNWLIEMIDKIFNRLGVMS